MRVSKKYRDVSHLTILPMRPVRSHQSQGKQYHKDDDKNVKSKT